MARKKPSGATAESERQKPSEAATSREREERRAEASRIALLQLRLGRTAQMYSIYSALALALDAFLAAAGSADTAFKDLPLFREAYFLWFIALIVGMILSVAVVMQKLDAFAHQKRSSHFVLSVLAVVVSIVVIILGMLHVTNQVVLPYTLWFYPVSVLPITLMLISLAATWEGSSRRKIASMFCAGVLPVFLLFTMIPGLETNATFKSTLILAYLFGALAVQLSGSMLLIIATATEAQEREIVKAGDTQISLLREEYDRRLKAVDYREKALRAQEAHLESREQELRDYETEIGETKKSAEALQLKYETQWRELKDLERQLSVMKADVQAKAEELTLRNKAFKENEAEVERLKDDITAREAKMLEREKELRRGEIDLGENVRKAEERFATAEEAEKRAKVEVENLDRRRDELIQAEKDMELRESDLRLKIERLEAVEAADQESKVKEIGDWEDKVLMKERELAKLEVDVRRLDKETKARAEELVRADARLQQQRLHLSDREKELIARQKQLSDTESMIAERTKQIDQQMEAIKDSKERFDAKDAEYAQMFRTLKEAEAAVTSAEEDVKRRESELEGERKKAKTVSESLSKEVRVLNERHRQMLAKEKELEQRESDLQLRSLETDRRENALTSVPAAAVVDEERERVIELREKRLRDREEEFRRRAYQKEKEFEVLSAALKEKERGLAVAAGEEVAVEEAAPTGGDRIRTGIVRFDDLMFGGMSMNSNVLLIGPAFVGKEVLVYNFIAEGLKKGVPAIVVTTTKAPVEIAKEMAPVLPSFMEYEQLGLVKWIDASGTLPAGSKPKKEGNVYRINGGMDHENIISVIDLYDSEFRDKKHQYFRLAYLTLSSSTAQADDMTATGFVQRLVNQLRQTKAVSFITLERGMHTDQQVEGLEHLMDGAIMFKSEKNKTLLSVVGLGEVQAREWIPYKFTNKTLILGAFKLERIK